jgi:hypothetical protein
MTAEFCREVRPAFIATPAGVGNWIEARCAPSST